MTQEENSNVRSLHPGLLHSNGMKARVRNGRLIVDEPTDLPEGSEWDVMLVDADGDSLSDRERDLLHASIRRGLADADSERTVDAASVLIELKP